MARAIANFILHPPEREDTGLFGLAFPSLVNPTDAMTDNTCLCHMLELFVSHDIVDTRQVGKLAQNVSFNKDGPDICWVRKAFHGSIVNGSVEGDASGGRNQRIGCD